jgi:hypothetical protein
MAIDKIVGGITNIVGASIGGRARRREERAAQGEFNQMKSRYAQLDTSNPYENMSNPYEDLTVNTQAADFAAQQSQQGAANVIRYCSISAKLSQFTKPTSASSIRIHSTTGKQKPSYGSSG